MGRADRADAGGAAQLYERHSSRIFGYCLSRLGVREDAEDATQLTFLHAVRGIDRGIVPAAEAAWLFGIARNVCLSRWAAAGRRRRLESVCDPDDLERLAAASDPHRDELIGLERALELLPEQQRRAVLLRDWRGLSYEEVADQLGVSHAAVETLIFRGRAVLAEHLGPESREPSRRLRSLGGLWSVLDAIKGALAGAKVAAAVGAAVAVSGGGIALGTTLIGDPAPAPAPSSAPTATATMPRSHVSAATSSSREPPERAREASSARPVPAPTRAPDAELAVTPAVARPSEPHTPAAVPAPAPSREPGARATVAPAVVATVAAPTTAAAGETAEVASPELDPPALDPPPLEVPLLPAGDLPSTDTLVAATEPITAVVAETVASLPSLPASPEPGLPAVPAEPALPVAPVTVPTLP